MVRKQLRTTLDQDSCDVCGRTMLKGEHAEPYLTPSRERRLVCQLCGPRAEHEGWIREAAHPSLPARSQRSREGRGRLLGRLRRRRPAGDELAELEAAAEPHGPEAAAAPHASVPELPEPGAEAFHDGPEAAPEPAETVPGAAGGPPFDGQARGEERSGRGEERSGRRPPGRRGGRAPKLRAPRHVRAVPTNAQVKVERAMEAFNASEHPRTVAGIARTLGPPHVNASTSEAAPAQVMLTVAWELSWYRYVADLSDVDEPVRLQDKGQDLEELPEEARDWNAHAEADGSLALGAPQQVSDGETADQPL